MSNEAWKKNLAVPFFSQRENTYVWYRIATEIIYDEEDKKKIKYNIGDKIQPGISMAYCSCNITSLCMILHYFGITEDSPDDMMRKVFSSDDTTFKKWQTEKNGPDELELSRNMRDIANILYGVSSSQMNIASLSLDQSKKYIAAGYPVWFSYGAMNNEGEHFNA
jgi:hypothetical protein